jgi:hypothetical protein
MKIDTTKDFNKYAGSVRKAKIIIINALNEQGLPAHLGAYTTRVYGQIIDSVRGDVEGVLEWSYDGRTKRVRVDYTDGRPQPEEKDKPEYYVVWIEGISPERGEKILSLKNGNHTYTLSMGKAMRVLPKDRETVKEILRNQGIANWAIENCMVRTNYAPAGTIFKL